MIFLLRDYYVAVKLTRSASKKHTTILKLIRNLDVDRYVSDNEIISLAKDPSIRIPLYFMLHEANHPGLYPEKYLTEEKFAEAYLVNWLEYPTELGKPPENIELLQIVSIESLKDLYYYVFTFSAEEHPSVSRSNGMLGVCGPYNTGRLPSEMPIRVFSRYLSLNHTTPEKEVTWVHENIARNYKGVFF